MDRAPEFFNVAVDGGNMRVSRWGNGPKVVFGIHGVGASAWMFLPIVGKLGPEFTLVAPDLRGRGASAALPGPFGLARHADDCAAVLRMLETPAVILGVSMGASVANVLTARHSDLVKRLLLIDMGAPLQLPPGVTPEIYRAAVLGPTLERVRMAFPTRQAYMDFWRAHPAISEEWNDDVEAYFLADLVGTEPELRPSVIPEAIEVDSLDQIEPAPDLKASLAKVKCPVHLIRAPRNLVNQPEPLVSEAMLGFWRSQTPQLTDEMVDDVNHYTLVFGERGSKTIVERIQEVFTT